MTDDLRLFHFTSRQRLSSILSMGELLMTPDPYAPGPEPWPVVWLSSQSGDGLTADSVKAGLSLDVARFVSTGVIVRQDKSEIRIEVQPDLSHMMPWLTWAGAVGVPEKIQRSLQKWPLHADWWWVSQAQIPQSQWVQISVRDADGVWTPMFEAPEVIEDPVPVPEPSAPTKPSKIKRLFRA